MKSLVGSQMEHVESFKRGWASCIESVYADYHLVHKGDLRRVLAKASKNRNSQWRRLLAKLKVKP